MAALLAALAALAARLRHQGWRRSNARPACAPAHSHSIVPGGLLVMS
jgi:hypothetical protein